MTKRPAEPRPRNAREPQPQPSNGRRDTGSTDDALVDSLTVQIVAGSYDRTLHGLTAHLAAGSGAEVKFADTFLFDAHMSAIRCLAISAPSTPVDGQGQKVMLATGGSDERVNVYSISAHPPVQNADQQSISSLAPRPVLENPGNREMGTLLHHTAPVTRLVFPTRSKLMSASEDSTIAVTRTRDWSFLSAIKAPIPKPQGRPSGDTAPAGGLPAGVNDFAVHPSMKLMITVSKGERCMRLWNLVTGKKAGVLNFGREALLEIGEGKHSTGEGRRVVWGPSANGGAADAEESEFAVAFDREVLVFGMDGAPRCRVLGNTRTKVHQLRYVRFGDASGDKASHVTTLAVSTEDGRICFYSTRREDLERPGNGAAGSKDTVRLPAAALLGTLGGKGAGMANRIKDFVVLPSQQATPGGDGVGTHIVVSGSSDGRLVIWGLHPSELARVRFDADVVVRQVGRVLGSYETQNRITCLAAFVMIPGSTEADDSDNSSEAGSGTTNENDD